LLVRIKLLDLRDGEDDPDRLVQQRCRSRRPIARLLLFAPDLGTFLLAVCTKSLAR